jgi:hypothetical protein
MLDIFNHIMTCPEHSSPEYWWDHTIESWQFSWILTLDFSC